jgi:hypothetical protein
MINRIPGQAVIVLTWLLTTRLGKIAGKKKEDITMI